MSTDQDSGHLSDRVKQLDKRVRTLETYLRIAFIVGGIFGVSGAYGYNLLSSAQKEINALQGNIELVKTAKNDAIRDIEEQKKAKIQEIDREALNIINRDIKTIIGSQLNDVKKWVVFIYDRANETKIPPGGGANGYWQRALMENAEKAKNDLK